ncbi:MAG: type II secretion system protein [Planctomycetota bacterium]|jgi:prepilin-type N-terminal cleavage/methylation domain-containing protein|nr:type II secretion system protein [Planctomycetota bacterium]
MKRHFTLIEMLVVVFIIALLAGIGFSVGGSVRRAAMRDAQAAELAKILTACAKYEVDYGVYPTELLSGEITPPPPPRKIGLATQHGKRRNGTIRAI